MMKTALLHRGPFELQNIRFAEFGAVSIDTRTLQKGDIFCALEGSQTDGHRFVENAFKAGALAAVVSREYAAKSPQNQPLIIVEDTLQGLQNLAQLYIQDLAIPVFALSGTAGKTSTRRILGHVLESSMKIAETTGNFNNHIGLPLSIMRIRGDEDLVLLEMGAAHLGDILDLCRIAPPEYGLITSIGHAHMRKFGNIENIQKSKFELFDSVREGGTLFINQNDARIRNYCDSLQHRRIRYGFDCNAHYKAALESLNEDACYTIRIEKQAIRLKSPGPGAAKNALAAYAAARTLGLRQKTIIEQLGNFEPEEGRGKMQVWKGIKIFDDTYNANPLSVKNSLETMKMFRTAGRKIFVFADMLEMGVESRHSHKAVADLALDAGICHLFCFGRESFHTAMRARELHIPDVRHFENKQDLAEQLLQLSKTDDIILLKGSRGMALEEIIQIMKGS